LYNLTGDKKMKEYKCEICQKDHIEIDIEETFIGLVCIFCDDKINKKVFQENNK
jgi:hypothetical protein